MKPLLPIVELTPEDVRSEIRVAIDPHVDAGRVADFLARVDWSHLERASEDVRGMLGQLEAWSTAHAEGDLTHADFERRLRDVADGRPAAR